MAAPDSRVPRLRVICGPTAAGKSAVAMALAERFPLGIVSADSRQVYRHFDIGTGKPTPTEMARVPHAGVDVVEPTARFSAAAWVDLALGAIAGMRREGRTPVVVGGTGFYIRALARPLFVEPALDPGRRSALERWLAAMPTTELQRWCMHLEPARAHLGRVQLLRAVEIALLTGQRLSTLHDTAARTSGVPARYLLVDAGDVLAKRMEQRIDAMFAAGWVDEVRRLHDAVPDEAPAWLATGYAAVRGVVTGERSLEQAREAVIVGTRQYAKRQRTWFRHQLAGEEVTRLDATAPDALERAVAWWNEDEEST